MDKIGTFTIVDTGEAFTVNIKDVDCYRGTETGTIFYMLNGSEVRVKESFGEVDDVLDYFPPVKRRLE